MKIILSPSKTKKITGLPSAGLFHKAKTEAVVKRMQSVSYDTLMKLQKLKEEAATACHIFWQTYGDAPAGRAVESYSGLAFKNLAWHTLDEAGQAFGRKHLVILSALYGIVEPFSPVKDYRLDLVDNIWKSEKSDFYKFWQDEVNAYFAKEDWILNLASKEYSRLVQHHRMITIEFWEPKNGSLKQLSTTSKRMRGALAHYVLANGVSEPTDLPHEFMGFTLSWDDEFTGRYVQS